VYLGSTGELAKYSDTENAHIHTALKVFRTSILSFKDRARYVQVDIPTLEQYIKSCFVLGRIPF
jgi:serine/threonine-protein kinase RIO1